MEDGRKQKREGVYGLGMREVRNWELTRACSIFRGVMTEYLK